MFFVFLVTGGAQAYHFVLYFTFCISWATPLLIMNYDDTPVDMHPFHGKKLLSWCCILILAVNGIANITFFNGHKKFDQTYEGLSYQSMNAQEELSDLVSFLTHNGYEIGYAKFWSCNIITEMSDGKLQMASIDFDPHAGKISHTYFLTLESLHKKISQNPFLILPHSDKSSFEATNIFNLCSLIYEDDLYCAYRINDHTKFLAIID